MFSRELIYSVLSYSLTLILLYIGLQFMRQQTLKIKTKYKYYTEKKQDCQKRLKILRARQEELSTKLTGIELLYETTRDVSKTLEEAEALTLLKITLKQFIDFDDCFLISEEEKGKWDEQFYYQLPLVIEGKIISYLAIKNLNIKDLAMEHLYVIANQFALVLKKIRLYRKLQELAITDGLTQTFSRRHLTERFKEEYRRCSKFKHKLSFLMLDIDYFKKCNDKFGHLVGDIVLSNVADEIKKNIRQVDFVGRFGGEEFAIVLPETDKAGAEFTAKRIRKAIKDRSIKAYDETVNVTVSLGVSTFPDDASKLEELMDRADWSLYRAKQTGRDRVSVYGIYK